MSTDEKDIEEELDFEAVAGQDDGIPDEDEIVRPIKFSADVIARDNREFAIVEINFKDASAKIVESSKAPKLTKKVLKEKGAPIQVARTLYEGTPMEVDMWNGVPLTLDIAWKALLDSYKKRGLTDLTTFTERETAVKRLALAHMIPETFSYAGIPDGLPAIEDCTDILLSALWDAYQNLHFPMKDDIYQVQVMRGIPLDVNQMLGKTFEMYPIDEKVDTEGMPEDELEAFVQRSDAQRSVIVSSMILHPKLSYDGVGEKNAYGVENLSEWFMQCLYAAYRCVNAPGARSDVLRRFLRQFADRERGKLPS